MDSTFPIWLFLLWTVGAPLLWLLLDHLNTQKTERTYLASQRRAWLKA